MGSKWVPFGCFHCPLAIWSDRWVPPPERAESGKSPADNGPLSRSLNILEVPFVDPRYPLKCLLGDVPGCLK